MDIYVTAPGADLDAETPALSGVEFGDVADYIEAPAGDYQVRVTPAGTKMVVIDSGTLTLASGQCAPRSRWTRPAAEGPSICWCWRT